MNRSRYILAIFDDAPWKQGDPERRKTGDPSAGGGRRKAAEPANKPETTRFRDPKTGEFISAEKFEAILADRDAKIHDLNQENGKRRAENKDLKDQVKTVMDAHESMKSLALSTKVLAAITAAKAVDPDVVTDAFLKWAGDKVKVTNGLAVEGLTAEVIDEFKKAKPKLFEVDGGGGQVTIDGDGIKRNSTSNGLSPGGGSNGSSTSVKVDLSKVASAADPAAALEAIVDNYGRSLPTAS